MTVESNYAIAVATLSDWFNSLAPVYQPMRRKIDQDHSRLARANFPAIGIVTNLNWFISLFARAVIGQSYYFGVCFTTLK